MSRQKSRSAEVTLLGQAVQRAKTEILADIQAGRVPTTVRTFAELHDYVDANEYGGLTADRNGPVGELFPGQFVAFANRVQAELDAWLLAGRPSTESCPHDPDCPCRRRVEALPTVRSLRSGRPSCGCRHRQLLGVDAEVVERLETPGGPALRAGRPGANVAVMWRFYTTSVYADSDLPVLCIRECLQNAVDAIDLAVRHRQIKRAEGRFSVEWSSDGTLTIDDNGYGMDPDTFFNKFMFIGESGKRGGNVSSAEGGGGKGGFGVAKAVILGTSSTFRWKIHSRDKLYVADGFDSDVLMYDAPMRQGTSIVLYDVASKFHSYYLRSSGRYVGIVERLRWLLALNDLDVTLQVNGQDVPRYFRRTAGAPMKLSESWGPETSAVAKVYKRGDKNGAYYVRLNGLFQFYKPSIRGRMRGDVVVDLETSVRPDDPRGLPYPLNAARDGLTREAALAFDEIVGYAEVESESLTEDREYDVLEAAADTEEEREGAAEVAQASRQALADPEVMRALRDAAGGVDRFYQEQKRAHEGGTKGRGVESEAPGAPKGLAGAAEVVAGPVASGAQALTELIANVLTSADQQRVAQGGASGSILTADVQGYLHELQTKGENIDVDPGLMRRIIETALDRAEQAAIGPGGGGMLQGVGIEQARRALDALLPSDEPRRLPTRPHNPFGAAGAVLIAKKRYSRAKARRFLTNYGKWVPFLVAWDATLRMIAHEIKMRAPFVAGFVLDDSVAGLAQSQGGRISILINPDVYQGVVRSAQGRPLVLATFLHSVGCHELAHANGGMGHGHDEEFVKYREHYAVTTAHLLPVIAAMAQRALQLAESVEQAEVRKLRDRLARLQADLTTMRAEVRRSRQAEKRPAGPGRRVAKRAAGAAGREGRDVEAPPSTVVRTEAGDLLDLIAGGMIASPPNGVEPEYVVAFFARMRPELLHVVESELLEARIDRHTQRWEAEEKRPSSSPTHEATLTSPPWVRRFAADDTEVYEHQDDGELRWWHAWRLPTKEENRRWYVVERTLSGWWVRYYDEAHETDPAGRPDNHWLDRRTRTWVTGPAAVAEWHHVLFPSRADALNALRQTTSPISGPRVLAPVDAIPIEEPPEAPQEGQMNQEDVKPGDQVRIPWGWGASASTLTGTVVGRYTAGDPDEWLVETHKGRMAVRRGQMTLLRGATTESMRLADARRRYTTGGQRDDLEDRDESRSTSGTGRWEIVYGQGVKEQGRFSLYRDEETCFAELGRAEAWARKTNRWVRAQPESGRWATEGLPWAQRYADEAADRMRAEDEADDEERAQRWARRPTSGRSRWWEITYRRGGEPERRIGFYPSEAEARSDHDRRLLPWANQHGLTLTVRPDSGELVVPAFGTTERLPAGAFPIFGEKDEARLAARHEFAAREAGVEKLDIGTVARTVAAGAKLVADGHAAVFREGMPDVGTYRWWTALDGPGAAEALGDVERELVDMAFNSRSGTVEVHRVVLGEPTRLYVYGSWAGSRPRDAATEVQETLERALRGARIRGLQVRATMSVNVPLPSSTRVEALPRTGPGGRRSRRTSGCDCHTILRGVIPAWAWSRLWIDGAKKPTWYLRSTNFSDWEKHDLLRTLQRGLEEHGARVSRGTEPDVIAIIEEPRA